MKLVLNCVLAAGIGMFAGGLAGVGCATRAPDPGAQTAARAEPRPAEAFRVFGGKKYSTARVVPTTSGNR